MHGSKEHEADNLPDPQSPLLSNGSEVQLRGPGGLAPFGGLFDEDGQATGNVQFLQTSPNIPPHWSTRREQYLHSLYSVTPEVKIAFGSTVRMLMSIKPDVEPNDDGDAQGTDAAMFQQIILNRDWAEVGKILLDSFVHDTGGYMELLSFYPPEEEDIVTNRDGTELIGPLKPFEVERGVFLSVAGLRTLDPFKCVPTGDPDYPVLVKDARGRRYALHTSRVVRRVINPSSNPRLNGIGMSYLSWAAEYADQVYMSQNMHSTILSGKPIKSLIFAAPWDGEIVSRMIRDVYHFQRHTNPGDGNQVPQAFIGINQDLHKLNQGAILNFNVEQLLLERLPEQYDRGEWSEHLFRVLAAILGVKISMFGIDEKFSSRMDSEARRSEMHNIAAAEFSYFMTTTLAHNFCNLNTCIKVRYNDEVLKRQEAENRRELTETQELELAIGVTDELQVMSERVAAGILSEQDADRIMATNEIGRQNENNGGASFEPEERVLTDYNEKIGQSTPDYDIESEEAEKSQAVYAKLLRETVRSLWKGFISPAEAEDELMSTVGRYMREAAFQAARSVGVNPSELTDEELAVINNMIDVHFDSVISLVEQVSDGSQANGGKLSTHTRRLLNWYPRWSELHDRMLAMVGQNLKYRWTLDPAKENCRDCLRLNGRVARASRWDEMGIYPKSRSLQCGGYKCGCSYEKTDEPVTRGRWPTLRGR